MATTELTFDLGRPQGEAHSGEPASGPSPTAAPPTAFVVEPSPADARLIGTLLSPFFRVTVAYDFAQARVLIKTRPTALLITELRLGEYNGLQLVLLATSAEPAPATLVTSLVVDPVLRAEAERLGATFVPKPLARDEVLAAVSRTIARARASDRGRVHELIRPPFERRIRDRRGVRAGAVDVERRQTERRVAFGSVGVSTSPR